MDGNPVQCFDVNPAYDALYTVCNAEAGLAGSDGFFFRFRGGIVDV